MHKSSYIRIFLLLILPVSGHSATPLFSDTTLKSGVSGSNVNQGIENDAVTDHGAGIAWIDYNNDDWPDIYVVNKSGANFLYKNNTDGTFTLSNAGAASELTDMISRGVVVGDYDNDGWDDLFVANTGINSLLKNNQGKGFIEVPAASSGLIDELSSSDNSAAFGDVDKDGDLDLVIANWQGGQTNFYENRLIPDGTAKFIRVSNGLEQSLNFNHAVILSDYTSDGWLDAIIPVDFTQSHPQFFSNNGDGFFSVDTTADIVSGDMMGIAAGDYDRDGDLDYYITSSVTNFLLRNNGDSNFSSLARETNTTGNENLPVLQGGGYMNWGTVFLDADNDADLDLYTGNDNRNFSEFNPTVTPILNRFYNNNGSDINESVSFSEISLLSKTDIVPGMGVAIADYDRDGRMDIIAHGRLGDVVLLRNETPQQGNHWLQVKLDGVQSNNRGIGAKIRVTSTSLLGSITQLQEIHAGSSHGSSNAFPAHFGFPVGSTIDRVVVEWPMGLKQTLTNVSLNHSITIVEGETLQPQPVIITGMTPVSGLAGTRGNIVGSNFCENNCALHISNYPDITLSFNGEPVIDAWVLKEYVLFVVPQGATSGPVVLTTPAGSATPPVSFTVSGG